MPMGRFGGSGGLNHVTGMQAAAPQGSNYALRMNSPSQGSPGVNPGQPSSMLSPRHRVSPGLAGSPRIPPSQFSPAGSLHSPVGVCSSTGNSHSYTNSSLNALQALSEGHGFSQLKIVRTSLPGTGTLCWGTWCRAGSPHFFLGVSAASVFPLILICTCGCEISQFSRWLHTSLEVASPACS